MSLRPRAITLALALAGSAGTAGCGSGAAAPDRSAFRTAYAVQSAQLRTIGTDIEAAIRSADARTDAQVGVTFGALATRAHRTATALAHLMPPADARTALAGLRIAVARAAGDLDAITTAARTGDAAGARTAAQALVTDSAPIRDARAALDRAVRPAGG